MEIKYTASPAVREVIASLGRTEDVRFSPGNNRLAVAAFARNRIAVFDIDIIASADAKDVVLKRVLEVSSACLNRPHGLDFIDDDTLIVANREEDVTILRLPAAEGDSCSLELPPIQVLRADESQLVKSPGSVAVIRIDQYRHEVLVCNNFAHSVTRHVLDCGAGCFVRSSEVLLRKWLDIPDGVSVSHDLKWIAVSNHNTHSVLLYENSPSLNEYSDPAGILRCVNYPHGLCFSADGGHLFVADAGAPYVHVYARDGQGWEGVRNPVTTLRVMDESVLMLGQHNPEECGPKGIDIDGATNVLVTTSEHQPLAFFDVSATLQDAAYDPHLPRRDGDAAGGMRGRVDRQRDHERQANRRREQQALEVRAELHILEKSGRATAEARKAMAERDSARQVLNDIQRSAWWRLHERIVAVPGLRQIFRFLTSR